MAEDKETTPTLESSVPDESASDESVEVSPKSEQTPKKLKKDEYIEGIGRRKRSVARVRIYSSSGEHSANKDGFEINEAPADEYFLPKNKEKAISPLEKLNLADKFKITVHVNGGGSTGQAEAVRMGLARAIEKFDGSYRTQLKSLGYLRRDPREKERKKPGLKKARRSPQWRKR